MKARNDTMPDILMNNLTNVTDSEWFRTSYADDKDNDLLNLTLSVPETLPTAEQIAAEQAKERAAIKALRPRAMAEEAEAADFYHSVFVYDADNDLEDFTYARNDTLPNRSASTNLTS